MLKAYFTRDFQQPWTLEKGYALSFDERAAIRTAVLAAVDLNNRAEQMISFRGHLVRFTVLSPTWVMIGMLACEASRCFTVALDHRYCGRRCRRC